MTAHIHAEMMAQYAKDAMETDKPWDRWEFAIYSTGPWEALYNSPCWIGSLNYRRKPRTIRIGKYDVPEPVRDRDLFKEGQDYWMPHIEHGAKSSIWFADFDDNARILMGTIYLTQEDAELCSEALRSLLLLRAPELGEVE